MKYLICSDIHGSFQAARKIIDYFKKASCDRLLILGDTLYHGPRNPLPQGHNPIEVANLLNNYRESITACRGNCDAEVDQKVLKFPTMADFFQIKGISSSKKPSQKINFFCSHGHVFAPENEDSTMPVNCEDARMPEEIRKASLQNEITIFFYGHTHISLIRKVSENYIVCNPGSPSLPKGGCKAGFALFDSELLQLSLLDIEGNIIQEEKI